MFPQKHMRARFVTREALQRDGGNLRSWSLVGGLSVTVCPPKLDRETLILFSLSRFFFFFPFLTPCLRRVLVMDPRLPGTQGPSASVSRVLGFQTSSPNLVFSLSLCVLDTWCAVLLCYVIHRPKITRLLIG